MRWLTIALFAVAACAIALPAASQTAEAEAESDDLDFDFDAYEREGDDEDDPEADDFEEDDLAEDDIDFEERWGELEELTVTGSAGQTLEVDAAESTVQFDNAELDAMGAVDVTDLSKITPNLEIRQGDATQANFFIRGVGLADFSANSSSAVAIFQDGVPLNSTAIQLVGLFDAQGVSVERGPQGAGSARNATAGAIRIDSRLPTGELTANFKSSFGTYASGDTLSGKLIQDYTGALEIPLLEDLLSARFSFRARYADPFQVNGCGNAIPFEDRIPRGGIFNPNEDEAAICGERDLNTWPRGEVSPIAEGLPAEVGDQGDWAARALLRFQPDLLDMDWTLGFRGGVLDQLSTLGQAMGTSPSLGGSTVRGYVEPDQQDEFDALLQQLQDPALARETLANNLASGRPLDIRPYRGDYNRVGQTRRTSFGSSLRGFMVFDGVPLVGTVNLENVSAYDEYDRFRDIDNDFTSDVLFEQVQSDNAWQYYQELKATGESDVGTFRWELGGYYLMEQLRSDISLFTYVPAADFDRSFAQDLWSFAFYGGFGYDFFEDLTLDAGVRYNWERKSFDLTQVNRDNGIVETAIPQTETWTAPTGLVSLTYRLTPDVATYAKYTRGWKGGHFNANRPNLPGEPELPARPETIDSIEVGARGSWFESRVSASAAFFYYKYKDYQLFLFEPAVADAPILEIVNANDAEQYGVELDLNVVPLQDVAIVPEELWGLDLTFRFGWLESQFLDFTNLIERIDQSTFTPFQQEVNYAGNRLPNSPKFKVSAVVQWPFDLGGRGTFTPRYDVAWSDDVSFGPNEGRGIENSLSETLPDFTIGQAAYTVHNLRFAYTTPDGMLEVAGWVRNLTDTRYKTFAFDARIFAATVINFVGEPRTGGADITIRF